MTSVPDYIISGLSLTNRKLHLVVLDMVVQIAWGAGAACLFVLAIAWFASQVFLSGEQLSRMGGAFPVIALIEAVRLLGARWEALAVVLLVAAVGAGLGWVLLEAFVRAGILPLNGLSFLGNAWTHFGFFLLSGLLRRTAFLVIAVIVGTVTVGPLLTAPAGQWVQLWPELRWPAAVGLVSLLVTAFVLMTLDTVLRTQTLDCLRSDFVCVIGIIGYVALFEAVLLVMAGLSGMIVIGAVSSPVLGALLVGLVLTGGSAIHSYLLLVRYFSLGIMRREKREKRVIDDHTRTL